MTPSSPRRSFLLLAAAFLAMAIFSGCDKSVDEEDVAASGPRAEATPAPVAQGSDRMGRKALSAYTAVSGYLKDQDPDLREHLQKAASKFCKDKDKWRERLAGRQRDLEPKITRLRDQLTKADGQSGEALRNLRQELSSLEFQRAEADRKLSELESVTSDTWKSFRDRLAADGEDEKPATPKPTKR